MNMILCSNNDTWDVQEHQYSIGYNYRPQTSIGDGQISSFNMRDKWIWIRCPCEINWPKLLSLQKMCHCHIDDNTGSPFLFGKVLGCCVVSSRLSKKWSKFLRSLSLDPTTTAVFLSVPKATTKKWRGGTKKIDYESNLNDVRTWCCEGRGHQKAVKNNRGCVDY